MTLQLLDSLKVPIDGLRSKSWEGFANTSAPVMDFVFTVCDRAAGEVCPVWPGRPITAHWGIADPAAADGSEADRMNAFRAAYKMLETRIQLFTSLRLEQLDRTASRREADKIGRVSSKSHGP
jgi:arsenate reductase